MATNIETPVETYLTKVTLLTQELVKQDLKSVPVKQYQMNGEQKQFTVSRAAQRPAACTQR